MSDVQSDEKLVEPIGWQWKTINRVLAATDNPTINPVIAKLEARNANH